MLSYLIVLFVAVPLIELAILIKIGQIIGVSNTLALVILTGMLGAILVRIEGFNVLRRIDIELHEGRLPSDALLDGFLIFCGGMLLITPGIFTDILGFLLLFPYSRSFFKALIVQKIRRAFQEGRTVNFYYFKRSRF